MRCTIWGCKASITPNIDNVVKNDGVSFSNAFCQNPVCTPSRCSFMTGWYPHVRGHRTMHFPLQKDEPNLLKILKDNGYYVWWGGKNDLVPGEDGPLDYCNEYNKTKRKITGCNLHQETNWRGLPEGDNYYSFYAGLVGAKHEGQYVDSDWANVLDAIDFIDGYDREEPFCIYLPIEYPHPPYGVEDPYFSMIDRDLVDPPKKPYENWEDKPSILKGLREGQKLTNWDEERFTELKATYLGMCARVDRQYGMIIEALKKKHIYDKSAVFMFSDHGDFTGDYGLVEKTQNTFQDCLTNVPFVIKPPKSVKVKPGISDALVELIDFSATLADIAGIELGYTNFGSSLVPIITGKNKFGKNAVFCEGGRMPHERHCTEYQSHSAEDITYLYSPRIKLQIGFGAEHSKAVMVRTNEYKYIYRVGEMDELYDLKNDKNEYNNLINDKKFSGKLLELKEHMLTFFIETGDVVPFEGNRRNF